MAHPFLSDEWFAAVDQIRAKYADQAAPIPVAVRMNQIVTDIPFADEPLHLHADTSSGQMVVAKGELDDPDLTLTTDWVTARQLFVDQDQAAVMSAFMEGRVKIQGDMMKLMGLQATMPIDDTARAVTAEIQALTE